MRIAFISYEFPPYSSLGGIATYVGQIVALLCERGHSVEVFCGSPSTTLAESSSELCIERLKVHRICADRMVFAERVVPLFRERHCAHPFDLMEGPDYLAEALPSAQSLPEIPFVIRLHTPFSVIQEINIPSLPRKRLIKNLRRLWYMLRTGRSLGPDQDTLICRDEALNARQADLVISPSDAISKRVSKLWKLDPGKVVKVGLPFRPESKLLGIRLEEETPTVTFVGRLEWRKGVQDLAQAIPLVLARRQELQFRFVGADADSSQPGLSMTQFIRKTVGARYEGNLHFVGAVPRDELPVHLAGSAVCVFPSRWESFGFVLLEAMAAGRACVCSSGSGLAEIAGQGRYARLVAPGAPKPLSEAILGLLEDPSARHNLGALARSEGIERYRPERIVEEQLSAYSEAIRRHRHKQQQGQI